MTFETVTLKIKALSPSCFLTHWERECALYCISGASIHSAEPAVPPGPCHPPGIPGTSAAAAKTSSSDMTESSSQGKKVDGSFRKCLCLNRTVETILLCPLKTTFLIKALRWLIFWLYSRYVTFFKSTLIKLLRTNNPKLAKIISEQGINIAKGKFCLKTLI